MERIRADLLRRARSEREREAPGEQNSINENRVPRAAEESTAGSSHTRGTMSRFPILPRPLIGRKPSNANDGQGPKSPDPPLRPLTLSSSRYGDEPGPPSSLPSPIALSHMRPGVPLPPEPAATTATHLSSLPMEHGIESSNSFPQNPSNDREISRQTDQDDRRQPQTGDVESGRKPRPRKFMLCFPWVKSRRVRSQILTCLVSGIFLASLLAVYLGLALTNHIARGELTIMIILVILSATMFFCYSVLRLCVLVSRGDRYRRRRSPEMLGPGGYVVPPKPIHVVLARDEEAAGIESEASKVEPPAYGLWRESVRVDPNRLFWQRNESADAVPPRPETRTGARPPSYASDDGISYVVEARPRSIAPPPHAHTTVSASEVDSMPRL
ncbi:hypothetical protein QQS21_005061 [Conoideocrella luteorostrata]|uniref:Uncharacterized protein n=1 Tax=Conoideocrella luteorostrata TaxID=1105319 RepID=A0AAJ0CQ59_9HYPO|nr:hypothetical protein QQS21_005061 [Conoideocrella luteorostrata]